MSYTRSSALPADTASGSTIARLFPAAIPLLIITMLIFTLGACTATGPTVSQGTSSADDEAARSTINALLSEAQSSPSPQRESLLLEAASLLQSLLLPGRARTVLEGIDPDLLSDQQFIDYTLRYSQVALEDDAYFVAQRILTNPRLDQQWSQMLPEQQVTLRERRADLLMLLGETESSIQERLFLQQLLPGDTPSSQSNMDNLWQSLLTLEHSHLQRLSAQTDRQQLRGWAQLALISKDNQVNLEKQLRQVRLWQAQWPQHMASRKLPRDLQLLRQLVAERPRRIALLLPQSGRLARAGTAIRDGFMAALYQAKADGVNVPTVRSYDSSTGNALELYQQAIEEGAQLVVGPLDKDQVELINQLQEMPVPVLAVNYVDGTDEFAPQLFQFGLAMEDEARQVAQRAWLEGHRYAMVVATGASWGERSAREFREYWESLGGTLLEHVRFVDGDVYADVVGWGLHIDKSEQRYAALRQLLGKRMEFEPRRRNDVDMLFLVARPQEARQINPTLAFHYASDIPVYATSQIYSGVEDRSNDRDLNDIRFTTLPWFFATDNAVKTAVEESIDPPPAFERLYALGVDAFYLHPRLPQLQQLPQTRFYGVTGALSMNYQRRIERQQVWAKISYGSAKVLPALVGSD